MKSFDRNSVTPSYPQRVTETYHGCSSNFEIDFEFFSELLDNVTSEMQDEEGTMGR